MTNAQHPKNAQISMTKTRKHEIPLWGPLGTKFLNPPKGIPSGETN